MALSEFQLIENYFTRQTVTRADVALGIGDDAALLRVPSGQALAVSIDTLVEGVHFLPEIAPADLGYRALAVNLSDLAAMAAQPAWATLALTVPRIDEPWLEQFSAGFFALAQQHGVQLVGGNTTRGPLSISVQVHGFVPETQALQRRGARAGDLIFVTGTLGDAALGLQAALKKIVLDPVPAQFAAQRWLRPVPRVDEGLALREIASACIDISDGLLADLGHVCDASRAGARIFVEQVPVSTLFHAAGNGNWNLPLSAGDDYELCFTAAPQHRARVEALFRRFACGVSCVGVIESMPGVRCQMNDGRSLVPAQRGYDHFVTPKS
ncbi:MAG: thiamine-phosphate kinase [Gammaproteobacteria bacterium]|nr:thiamine-phosphate kinase [Gammaproteobacteria bacterium]